MELEENSNMKETSEGMYLKSMYYFSLSYFCYTKLNVYVQYRRVLMENLIMSDAGYPVIWCPIDQ